MIIDSHQGDPRYLESRAIELVHEAKIAAASKAFDVYQLKMDQAITLLAIAQVINEQYVSPKTE